MESNSGLKPLKHVFRVALLLLIILVALILGRFFFVPESWGAYGGYRGDNLAEQRDHDIRHQGDDACGVCHETEAATHEEGGHATVRCELCHAPLTTHASAAVRTGERIAEMRVDKSVDLCANCHRSLTSRPSDFPQVDIKKHVEGWGVSYSETACFMCHNPHKPK